MNNEHDNRSHYSSKIIISEVTNLLSQGDKVVELKCIKTKKNKHVNDTITKESLEAKHYNHE